MNECPDELWDVWLEHLNHDTGIWGFTKVDSPKPIEEQIEAWGESIGCPAP